MPMKSVALAATNSGLNALMTEFKSKALWEKNNNNTVSAKRHLNYTGLILKLMDFTYNAVYFNKSIVFEFIQIEN